MKANSILIAIIIITIGLAACEKESINENKTDNDKKKIQQNPPIHYVQGHIMQGGETIGYYNRTYYDTWLYTGCALPAKNCLPTIWIEPLNNPVEDKSDYPGHIDTIDLSEQVVSTINTNYSEPLESAVYSNDYDEIQDFFNEELVPNNEDLPQDLINDFNDGELTIKEFDEGYFIVDKNADSYDDISDSYWE